MILIVPLYEPRGVNTQYIYRYYYRVLKVYYSILNVNLMHTHKEYLGSTLRVDHPIPY